MNRPLKVPNRATGPRSFSGKARAKFNAMTHGLFAQAVLLRGESQCEFDLLLRGFCDSFEPQGTFENVLVEKIASLVWRYRRLLVAERAEIERAAEFVAWEDARLARSSGIEILHDEEHLLTSMGRAGRNRGLISYSENSAILDKCMVQLELLHDCIKDEGFDRDHDLAILERLYGEGPHLEMTLLDTYRLWVAAAKGAEEERQPNGCASPEQCVTHVLAAIRKEITRLSHFRRTQAAIVSQKAELDKLRARVPASPVLDRILKYETAIDREIDRTLSQLERLQRIRLDQPVLPPVKVEVSHG